jgi:hypothetical protein
VAKRWDSGQDIINTWKIQAFELFDLLKAGVQAHTLTGLKVVDRDPLLRKEHTLEYLEEYEWKLEQLRRGTDSTGKVIVKGQGHYTERKKLERIYTDKIALRKWEKLLKIFWTDPEGCESISFSLNDKIEPRWSAILRAKTFQYVAADINKYFDNEDNQNHPLPSQKETQDKTSSPQAQGKSNPNREYLSVIGKAGGKKSKKQQPILEAVKAYMKDNSKTHTLHNEQIASKFCKKYNENNPCRVTVDEKQWEVFYTGNYIFLRIYESNNKKADNKEKSIIYTTFRNTYIPLAKKAILTDTTK